MYSLSRAPVPQIIPQADYPWNIYRIQHQYTLFLSNSGAWNPGVHVPALVVAVPINLEPLMTLVRPKSPKYAWYVYLSIYKNEG